METWLIDKSALVRLSSSPDAERWVSLIQHGLVYMTGVTLLEVGYSARTAEKRGRARASAPLVSMPTDFLTPAMEHRAVDVQAQLAQRGLHRGPSIADLLIAAAAEVGGRTLLHVDKDFDLIAQVTGQSLERLVLPM